MPQRLCARCRYAVSFPDEGGELLYCGHCGAPQIWLSEEVREQAEQEAAELAGGEAAAGRPAEDTGAPVWRGAVQCALIAGGVSLVLNALGAGLALFGFFGLMWSLIAPVAVLSLYCSRFRKTVVTPRFGAQLGVLTGVVVITANSVATVVELLISRFALHQPGAFDEQLAVMLKQLQAAAQGDPQITMLSHFSLPEFRVGIVLGGFFMVFAIYLGLSALSGAIGGVVRAKAAKAEAAGR